MVKKDSVSKTKKKNKKEKILATQVEVESEVKEDKKKNKKSLEDAPEPTLFHYVVVLLVMGLIFGGIYWGFEFYENMTDDGSIDNPNIKIKLYKYPFFVNGDEYSIQLYNPIDKLEKIDFPIEVTKEDLLSSSEFYFVFDESNEFGGEVVRVSGRLFPFLRSVYRFNLDTQKNIVSSKDFSCDNSTLEDKVILFKPSAEKTGVFYDSSNGCIEFSTTNATQMGALGDKFFYTIINE